MKKGIVVSDLHSGSMYAPIPPDFETYDGHIVKSWNPAQEYLWKCWDDFTWRAAQYDPDFIVVNGDCIEGPQRKSNGFEVTLPSQDDQSRACKGVLALLKHRCQRSKWYFTQGTPYHVGDWGSAEESIAKDLGAEKYWSVGPGVYCRNVLWLAVEGVILEAAHHISGASGFYKLTPLDKEGQWAAIAGKDASRGIPNADLLVRSHLHFHGLTRYGQKTVTTTPCWKLGDNYSRKGGVHRFHPHIGGLYVELDGEKKKERKDPCRVDAELYSLPPIRLTELQG